MMRFVTIPAVVLAGWLAVSPTLAQEAETPPESDLEEGMSLLEKGMAMVLRGVLDEMEPAIGEMQRGIEEAGRDLAPAVDKLISLLDDIRNYDAPERLPNGDIIIRRRPDAPPPPVLEDTPETTEL